MELLKTGSNVSGPEADLARALPRGPVIRLVRDLSLLERSLIQRMFGARLADSQRLMIQVLLPDELPFEMPQDELRNILPMCRIYDGLDRIELRELDQAIRRKVCLNRSSDIVHG